MSDISEIDSRALEEAFTAEMRALVESGAGLPFIFDPLEAFTLLGLLQLALRHPKIDGFPREFGQGLAHNIEERIGKTPAIREIARRGWQSSEDV
jgi:hypothetical protein